MVYFWLAMIVVFALVEGVTVSLIAVWFSVGSLAAMISAALGAPLWLQALLFTLVSGLTLAAMRPFIKKYLNIKPILTNADALVGQSAVAIESVDSLSGAVKVGGKVWSARCDQAVSVGESVRILSIEGVKLIVEKTI